MKIENIIGIVGTILIIIFVSFISVNYFSNQKNLNQAIGNINITINNTDKTSQLADEDVSTHNTATDCWLIIDNKVFDVTNYLRLHPGGKAIVVPYCGGEATAAFANRGGEGSHSQNAIEQLGGLYIGDYNMQEGTVNLISNTNTTVTTNTNEAITNQIADTGISLTTDLVSKHNTRNDCWIIINSKAYAVSNYLTAHPGGSSVIIPYCGGDATQAFATKNGRGNHSSFAYSQLSDYLIGTIGSTIDSTKIQ